jgi:IS5 family transposase
MVNAGVKNGVPKGEILKAKKIYRVVPQMKGLDEHFPNQLKY